MGMYSYGLGMSIAEMVASEGVYDSGASAMNEPWYFWLMVALNAFNIALTTSKIILVMTEVNIDDASALNIFKMADKVGPMNLELELYPDLAKIAIMVLNFGTFMAVPLIAEEIAGGDKPIGNPKEEDGGDKNMDPGKVGGIKFVSNSIKKNKIDDREYRFIKLNNEMKVMLVHDKDVEMSAAYNIVSSGSLLDP